MLMKSTPETSNVILKHFLNEYQYLILGLRGKHGEKLSSLNFLKKLAQFTFLQIAGIVQLIISIRCTFHY